MHLVKRKDSAQKDWTAEPPHQPASTESLKCLPALATYFSKLLQWRDRGSLIGASSGTANAIGGISHSHPTLLFSMHCHCQYTVHNSGIWKFRDKMWGCEKQAQTSDWSKVSWSAQHKCGLHTWALHSQPEKTTTTPPHYQKQDITTDTSCGTYAVLGWQAEVLQWAASHFPAERGLWKAWPPIH